MYEFHYNVIKKMYGEKAQLLMTDTDSFCYHIQTEDVYKDMVSMDVEFDTSNYSKNYSLYSEKYKKVIGLMQDETDGIPITEFVGLREKLYSYKVGDVEEKKCKGVSKDVVKKHVSLQDYKDVLFEKQIMYREMVTYKSV